MIICECENTIASETARDPSFHCNEAMAIILRETAAISYRYFYIL